MSDRTLSRVGAFLKSSAVQFLGGYTEGAERDLRERPVGRLAKAFGYAVAGLTIGTGLCLLTFEPITASNLIKGGAAFTATWYSYERAISHISPYNRPLPKAKTPGEKTRRFFQDTLAQTLLGFDKTASRDSFERPGARVAKYAGYTALTTAAVLSGSVVALLASTALIGISAYKQRQFHRQWDASKGKARPSLS